MPRRQFTQHFLEAEVLLSQAKTTGQICQPTGTTNLRHYRSRKEYAGLKIDQAKRLRELEQVNSHLKRLLANVALDKAILKDAASADV